MFKRRCLLVWCVFLLLIVLLSYVVVADSRARMDKLNYYAAAENHTIKIFNDESVTTNYSFTVPESWTYHNATLTCRNVSGRDVQCNDTAAGSFATFNITNPTTDREYFVTTINITGSKSATNSIKFLMINPSEIFHTLIEYGRGRGNYFFDSMSGGNLSGSGKTGVGTRYLPNSTMFELNYLHKILNIKQYFGLATSKAENATFFCLYPNQTVVRQHLVNYIARSNYSWNASYYISEIEGSWERMGYLGQDFDARETITGNVLAVNCTNIHYFLADAGGNISVGSDNFTLEIRSRTPFIARVQNNSITLITNGTQEVEILYEINNTEPYTAEAVEIEILAPNFAQFIGTRGELWGTASDRFRTEVARMTNTTSFSAVLVARFNTSGANGSVAGGGLHFNLTQGITVRFIPPWEANAYNPQKYIQIIPGDAVTNGQIGTNISSTTQRRIESIQDFLARIFNISKEINSSNVMTNGTLSAIINSSLFSINASLAEQIAQNASSLAGRMQRLQEFDEELVFLVTDSFGLQEEARQQFAQGNQQAAIQSLKEANERLRQAAEKLNTLEQQQGISPQTTEGSAFLWWVFFVLTIVVVGAMLFLYFAKWPPWDDGRRR